MSSDNSIQRVLEEDSWQMQLVDCDSELDAIAAEWKDLESRCPSHSPFATHTYVSLAWKYSRRPDEQLLILVLRHEGEVHTIAPFRIFHKSFRGIPARVVAWIAEWEGDRPGPLCCGNQTTGWQYIEQFFANDFKHWDLLCLREQERSFDKTGWLGRVSFIETEQDSIGFHISLTGTFDDYLRGIDAKVKSNWRNRSRKIAALTPEPSISRVDTAMQMPATVDRFIALERKSWKAGAGLGIGKDEIHRAFYVELTTLLAGCGQAAFYFLSCGDKDIAGSLMFMHDKTIYERHIAHDPEYSSLSPGIFLRTEIMKGLFGSRWTKLDLMGMHPSIGRQRHKADWATGQWEGIAQYCYRRFGRMMPIFIAKQVRNWLHRTTRSRKFGDGEV